MGAWNNEIKAFERSFGWRPNPPMPPPGPPPPHMFLWIPALGWWLHCPSNGIMARPLWHQLAGPLLGWGPAICHWTCRAWGCCSASALLPSAWPAAPNQLPFLPGVSDGLHPPPPHHACQETDPFLSKEARLRGSGTLGKLSRRQGWTVAETGCRVGSG